MKSSGLRVLIVEDEALISMVLQDMLEVLGHSVAGTAARIAEARPLIEGGDYDVAVLDVHVDGESIFPLAETAVARGKPVVFATGSSPESLPDGCDRWPVLEKPYTMPAVESALARWADGAERDAAA